MLEMIVEDVTFVIRNYKGEGIDYKVNAYAQDSEESDQYNVEVFQRGEEDEEWDRCALGHVDSCGNIPGDENDVWEDDLMQTILHQLFISRDHGIIRGF